MSARKKKEKKIRLSQFHLKVGISIPKWEFASARLSRSRAAASKCRQDEKGLSTSLECFGKVVAVSGSLSRVFHVIIVFCGAGAVCCRPFVPLNGGTRSPVPSAVRRLPSSAEKSCKTILPTPPMAAVCLSRPRNCVKQFSRRRRRRRRRPTRLSRRRRRHEEWRRHFSGSGNWKFPL